MQAIGRQPHPAIRAPDGDPVHYERYRPELTTVYRLVPQHAATFFEQAKAAACAILPKFGATTLGETMRPLPRSTHFGAVIGLQRAVAGPNNHVGACRELDGAVFWEEIGRLKGLSSGLCRHRARRHRRAPMRASASAGSAAARQESEPGRPGSPCGAAPDGMTAARSRCTVRWRTCRCGAAS